MLNSFGLPGVNSDVLVYCFLKLYVQSVLYIHRFTSVDSTNHQLEMLKKIPEISERQTLSLPHTQASIYTALALYQLKYVRVCAGCVQILCHLI